MKTHPTLSEWKAHCQPPDQPYFRSIADVAELAGCGREQVYRATKSGELPSRIEGESTTVIGLPEAEAFACKRAEAPTGYTPSGNYWDAEQGICFASKPQPQTRAERERWRHIGAHGMVVEGKHLSPDEVCALTAKGSGRG